MEKAHLEIVHCHTLCADIIRDPCQHQFRAIDSKTMETMVQNHLEKEHPQQFENLGSQQLKMLEDRINHEFVS